MPLVRFKDIGVGEIGYVTGKTTSERLYSSYSGVFIKPDNSERVAYIDDSNGWSPICNNRLLCKRLVEVAK